jgi:acyl-CoA thioesterase FadM
MDGMGVSYMSVYLQTFETGDWPVSKLPAAHPMPKENHGADINIVVFDDSLCLGL